MSTREEWIAERVPVSIAAVATMSNEPVPYHLKRWWFALGGTPGKAYEADGWELWAPLNPLYEAGKYAEAADRGRELVEAHPQYAGLLYNLACCESLAGRTGDAIEHLRLSVDLSERSRAFAQDDSDFDPIRDEPAFKELLERRA